MDDSTVSSGIQWIHSIFHPARRVARPTLLAMEALLRATRPRATPAAESPTAPGTLMVGLAELPDLGEVGGVARLESGDGAPVGIARVGRTSFVGFRLDEGVLEEVPVEFDDAAARIVIGRVPGPGAAQSA